LFAAFSEIIKSKLGESPFLIKN